MRRRRLPHPATDLRVVYADAESSREREQLARRDRRPSLREIADATAAGPEGVYRLLDGFYGPSAMLGRPPG